MAIKRAMYVGDNPSLLHRTATVKTPEIHNGRVLAKFDDKDKNWQRRDGWREYDVKDFQT